jgi:CRP-like cAMP-binding protein
MSRGAPVRATPAEVAEPRPVTPVTLSRIHADTFTELLSRHPQMMLELLRVMSSRLDAATSQQLDLSTRGERTRCFLPPHAR